MDAPSDSAHLGRMKVIDPRIAGTLALVAMLTACAPAQAPSAPAPLPRPAPAPPPPPPVPAPAPAPPAYDNWIDAPETPGEWRYGQAGAVSRASFIAPSGAPLFAMQCDRGTRDLVFMVNGQARSNTALMIRTGTTERVLRLQADMAETGGAAARIAPDDPLLDAMAFTRGRFAVEAENAVPLFLPSWAEVSRVIEDCR
jgi:hypothetical protein